MDDFLYILKLQLEGRLSDDQITDQMHIYEDYILIEYSEKSNPQIIFRNRLPAERPWSRLCANWVIRRKLQI